MRRRARAAGGFTVPELLIGLAVTAIMGLAIFQYLTSTVRSYRAASDMVDRVQLESMARNVVVAELSMAGNGAGLVGDLDGPTVEIGLASREDQSDTFTIRYLADRWLAEPEVRHITMDVARDSQGNWNLYRREEGATRQPAVQEVTNLKLLNFMNEAGEYVAASSPDWPDRIMAFVVRLSFGWGSERIALVRFLSPQELGRL